MRMFTIHLDQSIEVYTRKGDHHSRDRSVKFSTESELGRLAADWPGHRLVEIWNNLSRVKKVFRFSNRTTAVHRIWTAVQDLTPPEQDAPCRTDTHRERCRSHTSVLAKSPERAICSNAAARRSD